MGRYLLLALFLVLGVWTAPVNAVNCNSCSECGSATQIAVTAEHLPANAFSGCTQLTYVLLDITVTSVGDNAFAGCTT